MHSFKDFNSFIQAICDARNSHILDYERKLFANSHLSIQKFNQLYTIFSQQVGHSLLKTASSSHFHNNIHLIGCIFSACYSGENRALFYKKHFDI